MPGRISRVAKSQLTEQGLVTVPAEVLRRLGVDPDSTLDWYDDGEHITIRRGGGVTSAEVHEAVFQAPPKARALEALREGLRTQVRRKRARR
jgi:bifunctional DNA-binding transcriptional regulator/antitoxin component of YhaV-PrlF toxin-antitoxin module